MANSKVLFNPFDAPAAVTSNQVRNGVVNFRGRLGIESGDGTGDARRWGQAAAEVRDKAVASRSEGVSAAGRLTSNTFDRATDAFRAIDIDGDGVPDKPRAAAAAEEAGAAVKGTATGVATALGTLFKRKKASGSSPEDTELETAAGQT